MLWPATRPNRGQAPRGRALPADKARRITTMKPRHLTAIQKQVRESSMRRTARLARIETALPAQKSDAELIAEYIAKNGVKHIPRGVSGLLDVTSQLLEQP